MIYYIVCSREEEKLYIYIYLEIIIEEKKTNN